MGCNWYYGCGRFWKFCGDDDCQICYNKSFVSHPRAVCWNEKNEKMAKEMTKRSSTKCWFDCLDCSHVFDIELNNVMNGHWCSYCANKKLCKNKNCSICLKKSFASHPKYIYWNKENKKTARESFKFSKDKIDFDCPDCNHVFSTPLKNVSSGHWCSYCANKILCKNKNCSICLQKSFASHPKYIYWNKENKKTARESFKTSKDKIKFDCPDCNNTFSMHLQNITRGSWCSICKKKTEKKFLLFLRSKFKNVKFQPKYKWCINPETNRFLPFDFGVQNVIIELEGGHHFWQVSNWRSPEFNQQRDIYKMQCLFNNTDMSIIRIYQYDVWKDKNNWRTNLMKAIERAKTVRIQCVQSSDERVNKIFDNYIKLFEEAKEPVLKKRNIMDYFQVKELTIDDYFERDDLNILDYFE